jgi:LacI family transcriptional regulator
MESSAEMRHIGLVIKLNPDDVRPNSNLFYSQVLAGIEEICRSQQSHLLFASMQVDKSNRPIDVPRLITDETVDGLLLVGMQLNNELQAHLRQLNTPTVLVDAYTPGNGFDAVVTDNERGAFEAVEYLIGRGHVQIGMVGSEPDAYPSILERRRGYINGIHAHGLKTHFADSRLFAEAAVNATLALLITQPEISALVVANDEVAIGVMKAIKESGRRVPEDISIIGFDNIVLAQHVTPALTTMRIDKSGMGRMAAQLLFNRIDYPNAAGIKAIIRPQLIERDSVITRS